MVKELQYGRWYGVLSISQQGVMLRVRLLCKKCIIILELGIHGPDLKVKGLLNYFGKVGRSIFIRIEVPREFHGVRAWYMYTLIFI